MDWNIEKQKNDLRADIEDLFFAPKWKLFWKYTLWLGLKNKISDTYYKIRWLLYSDQIKANKYGSGFEKINLFKPNFLK